MQIFVSELEEGEDVLTNIEINSKFPIWVAINNGIQQLLTSGAVCTDSNYGGMDLNILRHISNVELFLKEWVGFADHPNLNFSLC